MGVQNVSASKEEWLRRVYINNNGGSASTCQNPVVQCEIDWQYPYDGRTLYLCGNQE